MGQNSAGVTGTGSNLTSAQWCLAPGLKVVKFESPCARGPTPPKDELNS